jgi:hypothetical protein
MIKYLFLILASGIFVTSAQAYWGIGAELYGTIGAVMALVVFLIVQLNELKPIILTGGSWSIFEQLQGAMAGKQINAKIADVDELLDARDWAYASYGIDFVAGLFVWPIITDMTLLQVGAITAADVNRIHIVQILLCVFAMQWCIGQYLRRGGKLPKVMEKMT